MNKKVAPKNHKEPPAQCEGKFMWELYVEDFLARIGIYTQSENSPTKPEFAPCSMDDVLSTIQFPKYPVFKPNVQGNNSAVENVPTRDQLRMRKNASTN